LAGTTEGAYSIRAVERVCDILDLLQESPDAVSMAAVAQATGLPKSSAFRYLSTLEARRYVERDPLSGDYRLGLAFMPLQAGQLDLLADRARPHLLHLCHEFGETINLGLLDGRRVRYLDILESPKAVRLAARKGDREPIHSTALGKAIAAHLPREQVLAILKEEGMPQATPKTVTTPKEYLKALSEVRQRGYAVDDGENEPDGRCVAVSIGDGSHLPAAISLSAPVLRLPMDRVPEVATALADVAMKLAGDLGGRRRRPAEDD
jgi:IclR family acetate operon transcriptional repressor